MSRIFKYLIILTVFLVSFTTNQLSAQIDQDSLFKVATFSVYDDPDKAIELSEQLFEKNKNNPEYQIRILLVLSNAYSSKRDYERSLDEALKAKKISEKLKDSSAKIKILIQMAAQYHSLGVNDKALTMLDEADRLFERIKDKNSVIFDMGNSYAIRGFIYRDQLSCDIAIDYLNKAYQTYALEQGSDKSFANQSVVSYNKGICFITLNQLDSAKQSFLKSKELSSKIDANSLQAFSMRGIAEVYTLQRKYDEATAELINANQIASEVGDLELNSGIYKGLADNYLALNDWAKFQEFDEKYSESLRQLKLSERNTIKNIFLDYQLEITKNEKSYKLKSLILISIFGFLLLIIIFSIIKSEISFRNSFGKIKSQIKF